MGCNCKKGVKYTEEQRTGQAELADVDMSKEKDSLIRFQHMFPLYKMHVSAWLKKLQDMGKDEIHMENMISAFTGPSFQG